VVWDLAPHDISIMNYVLGKMPLSVTCRGVAHFRQDVEDVASLTMDYGNNLITFLHVSWLDPNKIRRTTVVGTQKMLVYDDVETLEKLKIYDKGVEAPPYYDTFAEFQFSYRYGDIYIPKLDDYEPLKKEMHHFCECIQSGITPRSDGYCGRKVVSILEACQESIRSNGCPVTIAPEG
jgi:predicted dehydrogenase